MLPFWTSFLIRIYAWIAILKPAGVLNTALAAIGLPPVDILNTETAVLLGLVYAYLPFMVLPLYAALDRQDESLVEAAEDLGCTPLQAFCRVTFPLSLPGAAAGSDSGNVTRQKACSGVAPRSWAASIRLSSCRASTA